MFDKHDAALQDFFEKMQNFIKIFRNPIAFCFEV